MRLEYKLVDPESTQVFTRSEWDLIPGVRPPLEMYRKNVKLILWIVCLMIVQKLTSAVEYILSSVYPVSYCALIGTSHKLPPTLYRQPLDETCVRAGGCKQSLPGYPQGQSRTCYQECSCHLKECKINLVDSSDNRATIQPMKFWTGIYCISCTLSQNDVNLKSHVFNEFTGR